MKPIFLAPIILLFLASCGCPTNRVEKHSQWRFKSTLASSFIPHIEGTATFNSDDGRHIKFEHISFLHETKDTKPCGPESCCYETINLELKYIYYTSHESNLSFSCSMGAEDSIDYISIAMYPVEPSNNPEFTSIKYIDRLDFNKVINKTIPNCNFTDTITLRNIKYNNVYVLEGKSTEKKVFAEFVYYTTNEGLIGFKLNDNSVWTKE